MPSSRAERGHFTSAAAPSDTNTAQACWDLYAERRSNTASERLGTLLAIAAFPVQLLEISKTYLLSTLHLHEIFFLLAVFQRKTKTALPLEKVMAYYGSSLRQCLLSASYLNTEHVKEEKLRTLPKLFSSCLQPACQN